MRAPAFLLAAGFGTRLRPLTLHRPKPLVPLLGAPLLDQAVALLLRGGITQAVVNAHYLADQLEAWAAGQSRIALHVSREEPAILGTGGGLRRAMGLLADPFVVINGDILCDVELGALLAAVPEGGAAMALRALGEGEGYSEVLADASGRVVELAGLAAAPSRGPVARGTHFTGVHAMSHTALSLVPPEGEACVVRTAYKALVPQRRVAARRHAGLWYDLGTPAAYLRANLAALDGALALPLDTWPLAGLAHDGQRSFGTPAAIELSPEAELIPPYWIGPGATIGRGATIGPRAAIGAGASVGAGARLRDTITWDGSQVASGADLCAAIVHDGGTLHVGGDSRGPSGARR